MRSITLALLVVMTGCGWKGSPKVPIDPGYTACMDACPSRVCAPDGDKWTCLPEAK